MSTFNPFILLIAVLALTGWAHDPARAQDHSPGDERQNSTRKIRIQPGPLAARCGSAVDWSDGFDSAMRAAKAAGKPLFWYVPTVPDSFMDRKPEIDRYMMAGPFSWPGIIDLLNENFVSLRSKPDEDLAKRFDLKRYQFVEPGFVIIGPDEKVRLVVDKLTTLHPRWVEQLIRSQLDQPPSTIQHGGSNRQAIDRCWDALAQRQAQIEFPELKPDDPLFVELRLLQGMHAFRQKQRDQAIRFWNQAAAADPDHPLAWKAAAEAEGWGPFVRGFEVHTPLPDAAMRAGLDSEGSAAPPNVYSEPQLWQRGVAFLLDMQRADGGFVDCDYDFGGTDSLPNVHVAVTSLAGLALLAARQQDRVENTDALDEAIRSAAAYVANEDHLNRYDRDEILWAHAYRLRFLSRLASIEEFADVATAEAIQKVVKDLETIQLKTGGWYHEYSNPFVTGTALCALHEAGLAGAQVDTDKVHSGLRALASDRFANGAYPYFSRKQSPDEANRDGSLAESAGRALVCELARYYWEDADETTLRRAIDTAFEHHDLLAKAMKYDDHTDTMSYGGFFIWYDLRIRSEAVAAISDDSKRTDYAERQRAIITSMPELDGCFVDSHELGRSYGTAMALLSLSLIDR